MKTLVLFFLVFAVRQAHADPGLQSIANNHATAESDYQERAAIANAKVTNIQLSNGTISGVAIIAVRADGLLLRDAANTPRLLPFEYLGMEDRVRFGFGTAQEVAAVEKIRRQRERASIEAEKLELMRRQAEASEAVADELHRRETNRLIFGH